MRVVSAPRALLAGAAVALATLVFAPTAHAATMGMVCRIDNSHIRESSGVAASFVYPDLAYTLNDNSEPKMTVYAFRRSTCEVVGSTVLPYSWRGDTESIYADPSGRIWVGDLGDNHHDRTNASIIRFTEPGTGNHTPANLVRFPVTYTDGHPNVEAMLVNPATWHVYLVSKSSTPHLYHFRSELVAGRPNTASRTSMFVPKWVSDGDVSRDGKDVVLRTDGNVQFFHMAGWERYATRSVPSVPNPESVTIEPGGKTYIYGSEGADSPIYRYDMP